MVSASRIAEQFHHFSGHAGASPKRHVAQSIRDFVASLNLSRLARTIRGE
jgi:hypothetical protein